MKTTADTMAERCAYARAQNQRNAWVIRASLQLAPSHVATLLRSHGVGANRRDRMRMARTARDQVREFGATWCLSFLTLFDCGKTTIMREPGKSDLKIWGGDAHVSHQVARLNATQHNKG